MKKTSERTAPSSAISRTTHSSGEEAKFKIRLVYGVVKTALLILLQGALSIMLVRYIKTFSVEAFTVLLITSVATICEIRLEVVYRLPTLNAAVNMKKGIVLNGWNRDDMLRDIMILVNTIKENMMTANNAI